MKTPQWLVLALCATIIAAPAAALQPEEVLVVANANVPESIELAEHYAQGRGIPAENIVRIETTDRYEVSRADYDEEIRQPLLDVLHARTDLSPIRCICLMWGVPVRVAAPIAGPKELAVFFRTAAERSHNRLSVARQLLLTVGQKFPAPTDENSLDLADLFDKLPPLPESLLSLTQLQADIEDQLASRSEAALALTDAGDRAIAVRQLMALQMEVSGVAGLIPYVQEIYGDNVDQAGLAVYTEALQQAQQGLAGLADAPPTIENAEAVIAAMQRFGGTLLVANHTAEQNRKLNPSRETKATASVDSELAMIWSDTDNYAGPSANPLFWRAAASPNGQAPIMMTARIDGPSAEDARNIIDSSLAAEEDGLTGTFYVDAGMPDHFSGRDTNGAYARFDRLLRSIGEIVDQYASINVVIDTNPAVFPADSAPDAAMYIGWYSLKKYVPAFTWRQGAVAYHVASYEAMQLRNPDSSQWCPKLIQNGVAATIGAVDEPLLHHFPDHASFWLLLLTGEYTIVECYWRTIPAASWQMTLIADPLYTPFKANPHFPSRALDSQLVPPADWPPIYQRLEVEQPEVEDLFEVPDGIDSEDADQPPPADDDDGENQPDSQPDQP